MIYIIIKKNSKIGEKAESYPIPKAAIGMAPPEGRSYMQLKATYNEIENKLRETLRCIRRYGERAREIRRLPEHSIILWGIPLHGNLGDQAITYAETTFLGKQFPDRQILAIPEVMCAQYVFPVKRYANEKKLLFVLHGGGNMGQMYQYQEERRQILIRHVRNRPLIVFPQSVDFQPGTPAHAKAQTLYQSHPNLQLFARDQVSFEKMKALFPKCSSALTPDIVTILDRRGHKGAKPALDVIYCLRLDTESNAASAAAARQLQEYLKEKKSETVDTYGPQYVTSYENQPAQLEAFWNRMKSAKLIVTDRLHGMIFAMITNTPCIAFDNSTGKVAAFYNTWLRDVPGIRLYTGDITEVEGFADAVLASDEAPEAYIDLSAEFEPLRQALNKHI